MNYSDLYKHTSFYSNPKVEIFSKVRGFLKIKKQEIIGFKR